MSKYLALKQASLDIEWLRGRTLVLVKVQSAVTAGGICRQPVNKDATGISERLWHRRTTVCNAI